MHENLFPFPLPSDTMRLSLVAKKLNVGIQTIVEKLQEKGIQIENNPNTKLDANQLKVLSTQIRNPSAIIGTKNYLHYASINEITSIDLSDSSLIQVPEELFEYNNILSLDLSYNQITDIRFLERLTNLQSLDLRNNRITDYSFLERLTNLQSLDLSNNRITDILFLEKLTTLQYLFLSDNQITDIRFLEKLTNLQCLDLQNNQITDIRFLEKLINLQSLDLSRNQITDIRFLEKLTNLQSLDLSNNQITDIKALLPLLKKGMEISLDPYDYSKNINLFNNSIENPPIEIVRQGRKTIIEYLESQLRPLNECKLIFVGDGGVGKTSLMRRLVYENFNPKEEQTHGINKISWRGLKNDKGEPIKVNLWDFGGQHIQHSLHQFFFTQRVVYVLVLNPRNDEKVKYWLDQIEKLGCDSEILIVYNWKDEKDKEAEFMGNFYELRKKYPKLKEPFLLSCAVGEGVGEFKDALKKAILENEGLNTEYPEKWFGIKNRLETDVPIEANYIKYSTYQQWCREEDYNEPERQKKLLQILDSIGSIVFFDKPILKELQVLNPEWITTGAYAILTASRTRLSKGHLSWDDLIEIFSEEKEIFSDKTIKIKYDETQFQFILQLMLDYDLCQENPFKRREYLIPSAFDGQPNKDYDFAKEDARHYRIQFDAPFEMLLIHRFMARNISKIDGKDYWNSGIYINHKISKTHALVETNLHSYQIDCWIKGENIRGFWELIRADFRSIFSEYHNFKPIELVKYEKGGKEVFLPYEEMLKSLKNGVRVIDYHPTYELRNIDALEVLELFEDKGHIQKTMENERINLNINPTITQTVTQTVTQSVKVEVSKIKEFDEIKDLLYELSDIINQNDEIINNITKAIDHLNRLETAEDKAAQKTSIGFLERTFTKLLAASNVINLGLLPVDVQEKFPKLMDMLNTLKGHIR